MTPGSPEAVNLGCECSVFDNRMGKGAYVDSEGKPLYWYNQHCKIHGDPNQVALENMTFNHPAN